MKKIMLFPILIAFACAVAGFYGALHNQISYTVSPSYFHDFKFDQFLIEPDLRNRLGASIVGWGASWWMGFLIGLPIYIMGLFVRGAGRFVKAFIKVASVVVVTTLFVGVTALGVSFLTVTEEMLPGWMQYFSVYDPVAFARAGTMHNFSYIGGIVGLFAGVAVMSREIFISKKHSISSK
ncbi:hypothetical protein ACFOOP_13525 [Marinicaulis aureus]|uniref:Signal peptide-containing protein n=1 Tax=Hyphococcus aureus TaxID=2666033 RepID=A0ABW1KYY4_9PROT